jgi:hypothetical protein
VALTKSNRLVKIYFAQAVPKSPDRAHPAAASTIPYNFLLFSGLNVFKKRNTNDGLHSQGAMEGGVFDKLTRKLLLLAVHLPAKSPLLQRLTVRSFRMIMPFVEWQLNGKRSGGR